MRRRRATRARAALDEIIDGAVAGSPQLIRREGGKVMSRDRVKANKSDLRNYLLTAGYAGEHDAFDEALRLARATGLGMLGLRDEP